MVAPALLLFMHTPAEAQQVVVGRVTDELFEVPLEGVQVMLELRDVDDDGTLVSTDAEGRFAALLPGPGDYFLRTFMPRYEPTLYPLTVDDADEPVEVLVELKPQPLELEGIFVEVEEEVASRAQLRYLDRVGFLRRQRGGVGRYIGPEKLAARRWSLRRIFTGIPGIRVTADEDLRMFVSGAFGGACRPGIWIDGARLEPGFSLRLAVSEQDFAAVEVYTRPAFVPAQYQIPTGTGCGTVLIWTRR